MTITVVPSVSPNLVLTGDRYIAGPLNPVFSHQGDLEPQQGQSRLYMEKTATITKIRASVGTPSQGAPVTVDVLSSGTSVLEAPITIPAGQHTAMGVIATPNLIEGDYLTVSIETVGSSTAGANLTVSITIF